MVLILGVESTAHTFGIGFVKDGKILCNEKDMYSTESGGIIPVESANHHKRVCFSLYKKALESAGVLEKEIDAVAFSQAPGLVPCLLVGRNFSRDLCKKLNVPLIGVNHCVAHLEIGRITGAKNPVMLYASGANTQIISYAGEKYRVFGETLDVGVGNFIDSFARFAGIGFPGGPKIMELAGKGKKLLDLPYKVKGMDVAFSGILTFLRHKLESGEESLEDLAFSLQEVVFAMLVEVSERAMAHLGYNELLLGGGVACNLRLREMCEIMCRERGAKCFFPPNSLLVDNGAMIAFLGEIMFNSGVFYNVDELEQVDIKPRERTDDVVVKWK